MRGQKQSESLSRVSPGVMESEQVESERLISASLIRNKKNLGWLVLPRWPRPPLNEPSGSAAPGQKPDCAFPAGGYSDVYAPIRFFDRQSSWRKR